MYISKSENGSPITLYRILCSPIAGMKKSSIPIVIITQCDGASLLASLETHGDDVQARLDAESDVDALVGGGQEESSLTSRQSPGPTRKKSDKEGVFINLIKCCVPNYILFCKDYFTVYLKLKSCWYVVGTP